MTYCVLPWLHIATDPDGSIKPCCISTDHIKKIDGTEFNLGKDSIDDIFNSPNYLDIRAKMIAGEKVNGCNQCYQQEKYGGISQRLQYNMTYPRKFTNIVADVNITYFDLRFGNLCNLNCRSCSPRNSSQFAKEIEEISDRSILKFHAPFKGVEEWYDTEIFENNLNSQLSNITTLYITGGEPTIVKKNYEILNSLIENGRSKYITIKISSNMTNFNSLFFEMIDKFKNVIFFASIDGYGKMQEYLRYPSNWEQIDNTIKKLITKTNITVIPTPVIQLTNINKITELFEYFENMNKKLNKSKFSIMPIVLDNPSHLDLINLPKSFKLKCLEKIETFLKNCKFQNKLFYNKIEIVKNKCLSDDISIERLNLYKEYNSILDKHRNQCLSEVDPELFSVL